MKQKNTKSIVLALLLCIPFLGIQAQDEDILFQAFDWNVQNQPAGQTWYDVVIQNKNLIKDAGIDMIWMPPPSNSAAPQGYLPRELNNLNSAYGTQAKLISLINQYHELDIKVLSDIVINHRVGTNDAVTFTNPAWPTFYITADDEGRNFVPGPVEFSINGDYVPGFALKADGSNGTFAAARDLDHKNPAVRAEIIKWMRFLRNDIGFDGWRYDFVHGYDPIYNKEYNDATNPYFAVGELLESSRVQTNNFVNFAQQSTSAFDFNTKVSLQNAIRDNNLSYLRDGQGRPSGMIGINPSKSVTFLDNHDTGFAQQCCGSNFVFPGGETNLRKGYAYILTHPGNPAVFWTHFIDGGSGVRTAIKDLIAARKSVRVHAGSTISIAEARNDLYAAYIDGRNGTLAMKLGSGNWSPNGSGWTLQTSGNDYAVWTQGGSNTGGGETVAPFTINFRKPNGWGNNINAYFFDASANATLPGTSGWPGQQATNIAGTPWYSYTLTPQAGTSANNIRVIFNDGAGNQTDNLSRSSDGWYTNGTWTSTCPSDCNASPTSDQVTLNFQRPNGWGNNTNIYLFNRTTNQTLSGTPGWPGRSMNNLSGTAWSSNTFTLPNGVNPNNVGVVFNNGNGQQTIDLTRGTDGWFRVTGTQNGKRTGSWSSNCTNGCPTRSALSTSIEKDKTNIAVNKVVLSPNPINAQTKLYVSTIDSGLLEVVVSNIIGQSKIIYSKKTSSGNHIIDLNGSTIDQPGIYFYKIQLNGSTLDQIKAIQQ